MNNMKKIFTSIALLAFPAIIYSQETETLKNHADGLPLGTLKYQSGNQWGYYAGINYRGQQQFGERYEITEHGDVVGVVVHVTGHVQNDENEAYVRIYSVDVNGKPGTEIEHGHVHFHDLDLSGGATIIPLEDHAHVDGAFFATFDVGDYSHGGFEGDTIGVLYSPDGSRSTADLANIYRNVIQEHGHGAPNWTDFYSGNFTPIATHFAIYPIIEFEEHGLGTGEISNGAVKLKAPFPNPASDAIRVPYNLSVGTDLTIKVIDMTGRIISTVEKGLVQAGGYEENIDLSTVQAGYYTVVISTDSGTVAVRVSKK